MRFRAQVFDQLQLLYDLTGFNDHQLHCVLRFDSGPDAGILRKAVIASIEAIPILGTRYVEKGRRPHWESLDRTRYADAFTLARTEAEFDRFVTARIDERVGPQVGVCLLSCSAGATQERTVELRLAVGASRWLDGGAANTRSLQSRPYRR